MIKSRKFLMVLAGCCLMLSMGMPLQHSLAAQRTVLMELFDATW